MMDCDWLLPLLNKPWRAYATGPKAYDCWGVVYAAFPHVVGASVKRHLDVKSNCPRAFEKAVADEIATGAWEQIPEPEHGCLVLLGTGAELRHVGLWLAINGGRMLHSIEGAGVQLDGRAHLSNYHRIEYWRYVGFKPPCSTAA